MYSPSALMSASAEFYEALYDDYRRDPCSVDTSWRVVFELVDELRGDDSRLDLNRSPAERHGRLAALLRSRGHIAASLNPLSAAPPTSIAELCALQGDDELVEAAVSRRPDTEEPPLLIRQLHDLYCGNLTLESAHIDDGRLRRRLRDAFEARVAPESAARLRALDLLIRAESFERLLGARYPTKKRFGAEGAEAIIPLLDRILRRVAESGIHEVIIGTMHRGRLNLLANVLNKPLKQLFAEIVGAHPLPDPELPADVPYHLGYSGRVDFASTAVSVLLTPNPSHLEAVNPVALGRTRARQDRAEVPGRVLCILLHTDASVIGQGVVAETVQLSELAGYRVGGTLHLIINNQVGFTTNPVEARSSRYCTGAWKAID